MKPPAANLCQRKKKRKRKEEAGRLPQKSGERCKDSGVEGRGQRRRGVGPPHQSSDVPHSIFNPGLDRTSEPPFSCDASVAWGEDERGQEKSTQTQTHKCNSHPHRSESGCSAVRETNQVNPSSPRLNLCRSRANEQGCFSYAVLDRRQARKLLLQG